MKVGSGLFVAKDFWDKNNRWRPCSLAGVLTFLISGSLLQILGLMGTRQEGIFLL